MTLLSLLAEYLLEREISPGSRQAIEITIGQFSLWLGHQATLADMTDATVNRWLVHLTEAGKARWTIRGNRQRLVALWNFAFRAALVDVPPMRVRIVSRPKTIPQAWSREQLGQLLAAAARQPGRWTNGTRKNAWMRAFILVAYDSGLRLGDIERLRIDQIGPTGLVALPQHKTGKPVMFRLRPQTIKALQSLASNTPFDVYRQGIFRLFRATVAAAGLPIGTTRWLRRSSGSAVEAIAPGKGHLHLGNSAEVFQRHYLDPRLAPPQCPPPPRLTG